MLNLHVLFLNGIASGQGLFKVDEIAAIEAEGFKKGEQVRAVPAHRRVNHADPLGLVTLESGPGQAGSHALAHVVGFDPQGGDPGALFDTEPQGEDIADHKADHPAVELGHEADILLAQGVTFDEGFKIGFGRFLHNGCVNPQHRLGISRLQFSNRYVFHCHNTPHPSPLIDSNDLHMMAHPVRRQVDTTAVTAGFDLFFDHLLAVDFELDLAGCNFRGGHVVVRYMLVFRHCRKPLSSLLAVGWESRPHVTAAGPLVESRL